MSDSSSARVIGVDIGGSKILAGLVSRDGRIERALRAATPSSPAAILEQVRQLCESLIAGSDGAVIAIGIGSAGMIDSDSGIVTFANDNLPGWTGTRLGGLNIAGLPIIAENDARALAFGEAELGAGARYNSLLCVTVGTGIGGGLILEGEIWRGASHSAGEIGSLVVDWAGEQPLIFDQFVSGPAIERAYQAASGGDRRLPLTEISRLARAGDAQAAQVITFKARQFGQVLAGVTMAINPDALVIGGGVPQIGALWWDAFAAAFRAALPPPLRDTALLPATLDVHGVLLGAAMLAWRVAGA